MVSLTDELDPAERIKFKQKAYDKFVNLAQPAAEKENINRSTQAVNKGLGGVFKGVTEGGFAGRQAASQALDQSQLELAKTKGQLASEQDALNLQGAGMKEDIIASRQEAALGNFNRQTQEMTDAMDKAIAERAFDLGMTAKELAFHMNSKVADIGLEKMKEDYDAGNLSKIELQNVSNNLARAAAQAKQEADAALAKLRQEGQMAATAQQRKRMMELTKLMLEKQKEAMKAAAKASNISAILTGVGTVTGAVVGGIYGGPGGAAAGASAGGTLGGGAAAAYNSSQE